jgi:hypothetical protein
MSNPFQINDIVIYAGPTLRYYKVVGFKMDYNYCILNMLNDKFEVSTLKDGEVRTVILPYWQLKKADYEKIPNVIKVLYTND